MGRGGFIGLMAAGVALVLLALLGAPGAEESGAAAPEAVVAVAAASSLRHTLDELASAFERRRPGTRVETSYGASGTLYAQLLHRAPFDLFLSADVEHVRRLEAAGLTLAPFRYARGRLALCFSAELPEAVAARGLEALADPAIRRLAIANPRHAPYGVAAKEVLGDLGLAEAVQDRLVLGENVAQAAHFVQTGAAEAGLIAASLVPAAEAEGGRLFLVPPRLHAPLAQAGAVLAEAPHREAAEAFVAFLTGPEGRAILTRHGFLPPDA